MVFAGSAGGGVDTSGGDQVALDVFVIEAGPAALAKQGEQVRVGELSPYQKRPVYRRADLDREIEKFGNDRPLIARKRATHGKLGNGMIGRQGNQHRHRLDAVGPAPRDHGGVAPVDLAAVVANRPVRYSTAEIGSPLIEIERAEESVK